MSAFGVPPCKPEDGLRLRCECAVPVIRREVLDELRQERAQLRAEIRAQALTGLVRNLPPALAVIDDDVA